MELCDFKAFELSRMLEKREVRSREITESVLKRIEERDSKINAYISVTADLAIQQAEKADQLLIKGKIKSPIHGIPTAIKDNICVEGVVTTCASKILENYIPPYNAFTVQNLLNAGAVIIGKTNLDEFGMGSSTERSIFVPTHNPFNQDYVTGGSSGGSAAAVATGESILALGTDTGGSIRMPAAFCGVYGIKPTYGRVSRYGLISYASSLDQIGAIARSVTDCALIMNAICGYDKKDSTSVNIPTPNFTSSLEKDVKDIKIGLPIEYYTEGLDVRIKEKILGAVDTLEKSGAEIIEISLPHTPFAVSTYYLIATAEASSNLAKYDGVKFGYRVSEKKSDLLAMYESSRSEGFGQEVKRRILLGTYVLSAGYYDAYYLKAKKARMLVTNDFNTAFDQVDCILAPVTPSLPFKLGEKSADPLQMYLEDIYTVSLNLAGLPGMSVNCGTVEGLPVAFQIIGKPFDEATVIQVGSAYEELKKDDPELSSIQDSE
jgi:aspartyl-tRNA(Asn)/glutamyl-tRNA(Gln) amidotransferase subunit A